MTRGRRGSGACAALALALALAAAPAAGSGLRRLESVGAVALRPDTADRRPPRDQAVRLALSGAVRRVALELLPDADPEGSDALLAEALGDDPQVYTPRFRILEDRGERPALFVQDPEVESEYVVLVEVHVDTERVRSRLASHGLLVVPSGEAARIRVRLEIQDLTSYAAYRELRRTLLEGVGSRSVVPLEMQRGRALLAVDGALEADALLAELLRVAPPQLEITPLAARSDSLTLRVALRPAAAAPGAGAFDTQDQNRY